MSFWVFLLVLQILMRKKSHQKQVREAVVGDNRIPRNFSVNCHRRCHHVSSIMSFSDSHEQLIPPRFLERFTNKKVKKGASITLSVKVEGKWVDAFPLCKTLTLQNFVAHSGLSLAQVILTSSPVSEVWDSTPSFVRDFMCFTEKDLTHLHLHFPVCKTRDNNTY